jgi:hypothetical protein
MRTNGRGDRELRTILLEPGVLAKVSELRRPIAFGLVTEGLDLFQLGTVMPEVVIALFRIAKVSLRDARRCRARNFYQMDFQIVQAFYQAARGNLRPPPARSPDTGIDDDPVQECPCRHDNRRGREAFTEFCCDSPALC